MTPSTKWGLLTPGTVILAHRKGLTMTVQDVPTYYARDCDGNAGFSMSVLFEGAVSEFCPNATDTFSIVPTGSR